MPEGKWNAYEHNLRIPMVIAGPGIKAGSEFELIASNVDTIPTAFGLAGIPTPPSMDGRSYAHLLLASSAGGVDPAAPAPARTLLAAQPTAAEWRTEQLIEYGGGGPVVRYEHLEDIHNNTFRCLRVVDKTAAAGESNVKLCEFVGWADWDYTSGGADSEWELFDLDSDPYELKNLWKSQASALGAKLRKRLEALYACAGMSCN